MNLLLKRVLHAADAPEAVEAENDDIDEDAAEASNRIDEYVTGAGIATDNGELMYLVEGAINGSKDNWIKDLSILWEAYWMETLDEAGAAIAESAKEEDVGELAGNFVGEAEERGETSGFGIGDVAIVSRKRPD